MSAVTEPQQTHHPSQWDLRSQDVSDHFLGDHELAFGRFLRRCSPEPQTLERIHRLTGPVARPSLALVVSKPAPRKFGDDRELGREPHNTR